MDCENCYIKKALEMAMPAMKIICDVAEILKAGQVDKQACGQEVGMQTREDGCPGGCGKG